MYAEVNGIRLYYEISGDGQPLVMVHGNNEDHTIFEEAASILNKQYQLYLIDSRDHGQSSKVKTLCYEDMAKDLTDFMELLDLRDVIYYGFSDGGILGLLCAMRTDRIAELLISGANITPEGIIWPLRVWMKLMYFFHRDAKLRLMLKEPHISSDDLKKIRIPVSVIAGERDVIAAKETKAIADHLLKAHLRIIPKVGHSSYIVHKKEIADIILDEICCWHDWKEAE